MDTTQIRWGILSTAQIARKNWRAIRNSGNGIVAAVASRDPGRSQAFIDECQLESPFESAPKALGSYEALIDSPEIDAIYVPLPTGLRKQWVIRAAQAGKHVVCEKPCGSNLQDLEEILAACERNRVQFMDGVMFMHSKRLTAIQKVLEDRSIVGTIRRVQTGFSFCAPPSFFSGNIRSNASLEPHGCVGDLGWYCIRLTLWAMNWRMPTQVTGRILSQVSRPDSPAPVPTEFSAELLYENGVSAGFYCAFIAELQQWAIVSGDKGYLRIPDFVLPYYGGEMSFETHQAAYEVQGCEFQMKPGIDVHSVNEHSNSHPNAQESNLFRNFASQILSGRLNHEWPEIALKTQKVLEACLESSRNGSQLIPLN